VKAGSDGEQLVEVNWGNLQMIREDESTESNPKNRMSPRFQRRQRKALVSEKTNEDRIGGAGRRGQE